MTIKWRGKPLFIRHRSAEEIAQVNAQSLSELRHKQTDAERVKDPKWCVIFSSGLCFA